MKIKKTFVNTLGKLAKIIDYIDDHSLFGGPVSKTFFIQFSLLLNSIIME